MSVIKIKNFGGELPSAHPRSLPAGAAQMARNLLASTGEFRPLKTDLAVAVSAVSNPKTIHRLARTNTGAFNTNMTTGWITSASDLNYVKGQIDDDATERTYYTFNDGSAPPRVIDALGADRLLGVPAPTNAPGVVVNVVDEFTPEDATAAEIVTKQAIADAIKEAMVENYLGNSITLTPPNSTTIGWLAHGTTVSGEPLPSTSAKQANFCVPIVGGNVVTQFMFMSGPEYGASRVTYAGQLYMVIAVDLAASVWLPYDVALTDRLEEVMSPVNPALPLFETAEIVSIVASSLDYWNVTKEPLKGAIADAQKATKDLRDVIDGLGAPAPYTTAAYTAALAAFQGTSATPGPGFAEIISLMEEYHDQMIADGGSAPIGRYWQAGLPAVGYANLKSDMEACIEVDAYGHPSFNFSKFSSALNFEFRPYITISTTEFKGRYTTTDRLGGVVETLLKPYREFFSTANLKAYGGGPKTDADRMLAFDGAVAAADAALSTLNNMGALLYSQRDTAAVNAYALGAQARVNKEIVVRLIDTRFYIQTFVNDWDEESAPSPVSAESKPDQNDSVLVTCTKPPAGRNIKAIRLYRTNVGSSEASFQFLAQLDNATALYLAQYPDVQAAFTADNFGLTLQNFVATHFRKYGYAEQRTSPEDLAKASPVPDSHWNTPANLQFTDQTLSSDLQEVCPSLTWLEPPAKLRGLVGMPNGIMAGFVDNYVAFCDPFHMYAWPVEYQVTTEHPIVGLGVFGQTLFVGTRGNPYFISGSDSASMSSLKLGGGQACVSRRSIAALPEGVMYASPDGLCLATQNGVQCVTDGSAGGQTLWAAEDWSSMILGINPEALRAVAYEGIYIFFYDNGTTSGCYALSKGKLVRLDLVASAMYVDLVTDTLYVTDGTAIKAAFSGATNRTATYESGIGILPAQQPFAWAKVESDFEAPVTVRWHGDGALRHTMTFNSLQPQRLPPGRYLEHEVQVESAARVTAVVLAGSTEELRQE